MIEIWFYIIVCTGSYWCFPEHNNWKIYDTYNSLAECEAKGAADTAKRFDTMGEKWVAVCMKGVRAN